MPAALIARQTRAAIRPDRTGPGHRAIYHLSRAGIRRHVSHTSSANSTYATVNAHAGKSWYSSRPTQRCTKPCASGAPVRSRSSSTASGQSMPSAANAATMPIASRCASRKVRSAHPAPTERGARPDRGEPADDEQHEQRVHDEHDIGKPGHEVPRAGGDMPRGQGARVGPLPAGIIVSMSTRAASSRSKPLDRSGPSMKLRYVQMPAGLPISGPPLVSPSLSAPARTAAPGGAHASKKARRRRACARHPRRSSAKFSRSPRSSAAARTPHRSPPSTRSARRRRDG